MDGTLGIGTLAYLIHVMGGIGNANYALACFWVSMTVSEVPTGYLTDRWGPKVSLQSCLLLQALAFLLYFLGAWSTPFVIVGALVCGFAYTLSTGATGVQLKLSARAMGIEVDFARYASRNSLYRSLGSVIGIGIGFLLIKFVSLGSIFLAAALMNVGMATYIQAFWLKVKGENEHHVVRQIRRGWNHIKTTPVLRLLLIFNAAMLVLSLSLNDNWPPVYVPGLENSPALLAGGMMAYWALRAGSSWLWSKVENRLGFVLAPAIAIYGISNVAAGAMHHVFSFVAFAIGAAILTVCVIQLSHAMIHHLPEDDGGTVSSLQSLFENIGGAAALALLGFFLQHHSVQLSWIISGALTLGLSLWVFVVRRAIAPASAALELHPQTA
jgi:MFS family permease